jgi:hypothetical protein
MTPCSDQIIAQRIKDDRSCATASVVSSITRRPERCRSRRSGSLCCSISILTARSRQIWPRAARLLFQSAPRCLRKVETAKLPSEYGGGLRRRFGRDSDRLDGYCRRLCRGGRRRVGAGGQHHAGHRQTKAEACQVLQDSSFWLSAADFVSAEAVSTDCAPVATAA